MNLIISFGFLIIGIIIGFIISYNLNFILRKILKIKPKYKLIDYEINPINIYQINFRKDKVNEIITLIFLGKNNKRIKYKNKRFEFRWYDISDKGKYFIDCDIQDFIDEISIFEPGLSSPINNLENRLN